MKEIDARLSHALTTGNHDDATFAFSTSDGTTEFSPLWHTKQAGKYKAFASWGEHTIIVAAEHVLHPYRDSPPRE